MTSAIDATKPTHVGPQTGDVRENFQAAHDEITQLQQLLPHISQAVDLRTLGFVFGDDSAAAANSAVMAAAVADATARGKFLVANFADLGALSLSSTFSPTTGMISEDGSEFRMIGHHACLSIFSNSGSTARDRIKYRGFKVRKTYFEAQTIQSMSMDAAGVLTVQFYNPVPFVVGDGYNQTAYDFLGHAGNFSGRALVSVSPDKLTCVWNTGVAGQAFASFDPSFPCTPIAMSRRGGRLTVTTSAAHNYRPGMRVSVISGHVVPGNIRDFPYTPVQTGRLSSANPTVQLVDQLTSTAGMMIGMGVWATDSALPRNCTVRSFNPDTGGRSSSGTQLFINGAYLGNNSVHTFQFTYQPMDFQNRVITRVPSATTFVIEDEGYDDDAIDLTTYLPVIALTNSDVYVAHVRNTRSSSSDAMAMVVNSSHFLEFREVDIFGTGVINSGLTDSVYHRVRTHDTQMDAFHQTNGCKRNRFELCEAEMALDDQFPIVDYDGFPETSSDIVFTGCVARGRYGTGGRGFLFSGGTNITVENGYVEYSSSGWASIHDQSSFFCKKPYNHIIRGLTVKGCGVGNSLAAVWFQGPEQVDCFGLSVLDSQFGAMGFISGKSLKFKDTVLDWSERDLIDNFMFNTNTLEDVEFDGLVLRESNGSAIVIDRRIRGNFILRDVIVEDLNWSGSAGAALVAFGPNPGPTPPRGNLVIDGIRWRNQRYANVTGVLPSGFTASFAHRVRYGPGEMNLPWFLGDHAVTFDNMSNNGLTVIGLLRTDGNGLDLTTASGDYQFTVPRGLEGKRYVPAELVAFVNGGSGSVTGAGDIEIWTGPGRTGAQLFSKGSTWVSLAGNASRRLCVSTLVRGYFVAGSATVQFPFNGASGTFCRMDDAMPGQSATATFTFTGNTHTSITVDGIATSTTNILAIGMPVSGSGIQAGTTIASVGSGTITLSLPTTTTVTGVTVTADQFAPGTVVNSVDRANQTVTFSTPVLRGDAQGGIEITLNGIQPQSANVIRSITIGAPFTFTFDPAVPPTLTVNISTGALINAPTVSTVLTVPGAVVGDKVDIFPPSTYAAGTAGLLAWGEVTAANQVTVWLVNLLVAAAPNLASGTWSLQLSKPASTMYLNVASPITGSLSPVSLWVLGRAA